MSISLLLLLVLFLEVICLYFFSKLLIQAISKIIYLLTRSEKLVIYTLSIIFFPGTLIHELAHAISAGVMFVHVGNIEFVPKITERGVKLGSVEITKTDAIRRSLIGVSPVIVGLTIIISSLYLLIARYSLQDLPFWAGSVALYILLVISNTMFSSRKDMEGVLEVFVIIAAIFIACYLLGFYQPFQLVDRFLIWQLEFFKKVILLLLIPIGLDLVIYLLFKLLLFRR
jgi:hypothetical protein